jgi:hypothetical protein
LIIVTTVEERKHSTTDDTLQFTTDEALLGNGPFKGSIPSGSTDPADKVVLSYLSAPFIQNVNDELWNRPVSDFEYIEYALFKVDACDGTKTSCPKQFYLNVYTRSDAPCPSGDKTLLQNAADNNYVLGTNDQFPMPPGGAGLIFSLNMGDSSISDAGLSGYFDAVVVKLQGEDARVFDLEP